MSSNIEFYDAFAPLYEVVYGTIDAVETVRQWLVLLESCGTIPNLALRRAAPLRLLDVGCGPGWHLFPWMEAGFDVSGLDASPAMLKFAADSFAAGCQESQNPCPSSSGALYWADIRDPGPLLGIGAFFNIATSHFNFLHLFPMAELSSVFNGVSRTLLPGGIWATDIYLTADVDARVAMDTKMHRVHTLTGEQISRATAFHLADHRCEQRWHVAGQELVEQYWLHDLASLRAIAEHSGWEWLGDWNWSPEYPASPWNAAGASGERKVLILRWQGNSCT